MDEQLPRRPANAVTYLRCPLKTVKTYFRMGHWTLHNFMVTLATISVTCLFSHHLTLKRCKDCAKCITYPTLSCTV